MATGFRNSSGTDLSSLYEPHHTGTKITTGYRDSAGKDVGNTFQSVTGAPSGATYTKGVNCGYLNSSGKDIGPLLVKKGTYSETEPLTGEIGTSGLGALELYAGTQYLPCTVSGGASPYTYSWSMEEPSVGVSIISGATEWRCRISVPSRQFAAPGGKFVCVVKDSAGQTKTIKRSFTVQASGSGGGGGIGS